MFSIGFVPGDLTTVVVRIGDHGRWASSGDDQAPASLRATARMLFSLALTGRYREKAWTNALKSRYQGGESYFLDRAQQWRRLGPAWQPPPLLRPVLTQQDRRYHSY